MATTSCFQCPLYVKLLESVCGNAVRCSNFLLGVTAVLPEKSDSPRCAQDHQSGVCLQSRWNKIGPSSKEFINHGRRGRLCTRTLRAPSVGSRLVTLLDNTKEASLGVVF